MTILDRTIAVLEKVRFSEVQDVLNELRTIKLQSMNDTSVQQLKVTVLKTAQAEASRAYQAIEHLDNADELLALVAMINKEIVEANK